jgi:hypothetical protein
MILPQRAGRAWPLRRGRSEGTVTSDGALPPDKTREVRQGTKTCHKGKSRVTDFPDLGLDYYRASLERLLNYIYPGRASKVSLKIILFVVGP